MLKPMVRFSPWPYFLWIFMSFCCKEISTSSDSFVTSNRYCGRNGERGVSILVKEWTCAWMWWHKVSSSTWGFCRKVCLWLPHPPQRFNSGSAFLVQLPKSTTSSHVLWTLTTEVLMIRQTSASVKNLHQSVNAILQMSHRQRVTAKEETKMNLHFFQKTYQNSPSSSTVRPSLLLSVSPTFAHSSELKTTKFNNKIHGLC